MICTTRITKLTVVPNNQPVFSEMATDVEIVDEGAGEFLAVSQSGKRDARIFINPEEWPDLRAAIDRMIGECKEQP